MGKPAKHRAKTQGEPAPPSLIYFEDRGGVYDAPIDAVWDYIETDTEFHPKAHASSLRNMRGKDLSEVTWLIRCEVKWEGRWRRMVSRFTSIRPALRINEELEGPYAGSKMVYLYTPRGKRTAVDVLCYMQSNQLTPEQLKNNTLRFLASAFAEDTPFLHRFVQKRSAA